MSFDFPPLFDAADKASDRRQAVYLWLIRAEYTFLFVSACLVIAKSETRNFIAINALVFVAALGALALRAYAKPEQAWYKSRALAESIKTLSWRFSMRAAPYDDELVADARKDFRANLTELLSTNSELGSSLAEFDNGGPQITNSMITMRAGDLAHRKETYLNERVRDQRSWYQRKSIANSRAARIWLFIGVACYVIAIGMVLAPLHTPSLSKLPVEPIIVIASAVLGWMQIKKFNELASAYALTAQEISIAEGLIDDADDERGFGQAVNDVELVFSREHTQWVARQTS
ncbi:DUF4231 domain-containing protein [Rhizobium leguminosarum bv. viciae]|uniref:DUF4231 domain-containing protein n=1 Tax=Rhizobium leguminosarum TaxID=384 RepID=UPI00103F5189|nr:DUF4231 domain-containing protein [Rhizobium leguminosarum]TBY17672.1 DUF4231 domain-containing protein [Rhizobium leguminosarum bv. viciae]TCA92477.1 DUF4231 domain-containing protein [Rhizobium leguminosarum bv. viciae]